MRYYKFLPSTIFLFLVAYSRTLYAFDFATWDDILKKNVKPATASGISYNGFQYEKVLKSDEFDSLLEELNSFRPETMTDKDEITAFWINAYNIFAVKLVREHYPVKSILDIGGILFPVWKTTAGNVGRRGYSLYEIEHKILRPMGNPAIHFAIVCASVSCPNLRAEAYTGPRLREQLRSQTAEFIGNTGKGIAIKGREKSVYLSKIFDWYEKDFRLAGGVIHYLNSNLGGTAVIPENYTIKYLRYNWNLNIRK